MACRSRSAMVVGVGPDWPATDCAFGEARHEVGRLIPSPWAAQERPCLTASVHTRCALKPLGYLLRDFLGSDTKLRGREDEPLRCVPLTLALCTALDHL